MQKKRNADSKIISESGSSDDAPRKRARESKQNPPIDFTKDKEGGPAKKTRVEKVTIDLTDD